MHKYKTALSRVELDEIRKLAQEPQASRTELPALNVDSLMKMGALRMLEADHSGGWRLSRRGKQILQEESLSH